MRVVMMYRCVRRECLEYLRFTRIILHDDMTDEGRKRRTTGRLTESGACRVVAEDVLLLLLGYM